MLEHAEEVLDSVSSLLSGQEVIIINGGHWLKGGIVVAVSQPQIRNVTGT